MRNRISLSVGVNKLIAGPPLSSADKDMIWLFYPQFSFIWLQIPTERVTVHASILIYIDVKYIRCPIQGAERTQILAKLLYPEAEFLDEIQTKVLKVPKCENFHRTDFFDFFTIKPLWVGDFRAKIKNEKF
jgi:hypothetical protein